MSDEKAKTVRDGGGKKKVGPRIVIINTEYVETDAVSFKSVVQKLTGKDDDHSSTVAAHHHRRVQVPRSADQTVEYSVAAGKRGVLTRDISFKDFDTLLRDMPTMDDLWVD